MSDDSDGGESRRKRIRQACLNCRRKKVRCGGEKPICTFCSKLSQTCVYTEDGRSHRRGPPSVHVAGEGLSDALDGALASRITSVEERLTRMEGTLERFESLLSSLVQASPRPQLPQQPSPSSHTGSMAGQMPLDGRMTESSTLLDMPTAVPSALGGFVQPPLHTLIFAADVYFRFYHNQPFSLFHEATFRKRLAAGELPEHQIWALLAVARRYSTLPDLQLSAVDDAICFAKRAWDCMKLPWSGAARLEEAVPVIQTILLIVSIELPACECASAFMKLGFAIRLAMFSSMQHDADKSLSPQVREERRRTFWSLYLQDKLVSLTKEWFPVLRDEECPLRLPCSEPAFQEGHEETTPTLADFSGDCLDAAAVESCCPLALITVMGSVLSRVSQYVLRESRYAQHGPPWSSSSPYASISSTLLQLEMHFGMGDPVADGLRKRCFIDGAVDQHLAGSYVYSKAVFHLSHCLLHHPFLLQQRLKVLGQKAPPTFIRSAWQICRTHAMSLTSLKDMRDHNVVIVTSLYGYCIMVAGTIHVLAMNDEDPKVREEGSKHYKAALEFLRELSCYWKHASLMVTALKPNSVQRHQADRYLKPQTRRLERFAQQNKVRHPSLDPSNQDAKALWLSVDYAQLSTVTRPGTPTEENDTFSQADFFLPANGFFDFANLSMLGEATDSFANFPLLDGNLLQDTHTVA